MENKDLSFEVPEELAGYRLDKGISEFYEDISRSGIVKRIKDGNAFLKFTKIVKE